MIYSWILRNNISISSKLTYLLDTLTSVMLCLSSLDDQVQSIENNGAMQIDLWFSIIEDGLPDIHPTPPTPHKQ